MIEKVTQKETFKDVRVYLENQFHCMNILYRNCEVAITPFWEGQQTFMQTDPAGYLIHIDGIGYGDGISVEKEFKASRISIELQELYGNELCIFWPWE